MCNGLAKRRAMRGLVRGAWRLAFVSARLSFAGRLVLVAILLPLGGCTGSRTEAAWVGGAILLCQVAVSVWAIWSANRGRNIWTKRD